MTGLQREVGWRPWKEVARALRAIWQGAFRGTLHGHNTSVYTYAVVGVEEGSSHLEVEWIACGTVHLMPVRRRLLTIQPSRLKMWL